MAANPTIQLKRKITSGTPSSLSLGEPAVNTADNQLFVGVNSSGVKWIGAEIENSATNGTTWTSDLKLATKKAIGDYFAPLSGAAFTGDISLSSGSDIRFIETGGGTDYVAIQAPSVVATGNVTLTLPGSYAAADGYVLSSTTTGTLSWISAGAASSVVVATDNTNTTRYVVLSAASSTANLYVDNSTTPLAYNPFNNTMSLGTYLALSGAGNGSLAAHSYSGSRDDIAVVYQGLGSDTNSTITLTGASTASSTAAIDATTTTITSTTVNLNGAIATTGASFELPTSYTFADTGTATNTLNIQTGVAASGATKTLNIGTGGAAGSTTNVNIGSANGGTVTINSDAVVSGNLTVNGTTTTVSSTTITVNDPLLALANNNSSTDIVDIGFYGLYDTSGTQDLYCGLFRDASDDKFKLFKSLQSAPTTTVNTAGTGYTVSTLVADLEGKVNGLTVTSSTGTLTVTNGKTLSVSNTLTFTGTDSSSVAFGGGGTVAYTSNNLGAFSATTSAQLAGVINDETGFTSGALLVFNTSPSFTTSVVTGSTTFGVFDTTATTIDAFGAATTGNIGYDGTASSSTNISTGATGSGNTKTLNLGTGAAASSTTNVNIGSSNGGTTTINSGTVVGAASTQNLFNTVATTMNFAGAATSLIMGATTGNSTIRTPTLNISNSTTAGTLQTSGAGSLILQTGGTSIDGTNASIVISATGDGLGEVSIEGGNLRLGSRTLVGPSVVPVGILFEGTTSDANEIFLTCGDPTGDFTITLPNATGTVITSGNINTTAFEYASSELQLKTIDGGTYA